MDDLERLNGNSCYVAYVRMTKEEHDIARKRADENKTSMNTFLRQYLFSGETSIFNDSYARPHIPDEKRWKDDAEVTVIKNSG